MFALSSIQITPAGLKSDADERNKTELKAFSYFEGDSSSQRRPDDTFSPK